MRFGKRKSNDPPTNKTKEGSEHKYSKQFIWNTWSSTRYQEAMGNKYIGQLIDKTMTVNPGNSQKDIDAFCSQINDIFIKAGNISLKCIFKKPT